MKFPLRSATKKYLAMREERVKESTLDNESRILWHIVSILEEMVKQGELSTSNPWKMGRKEIRAILNRLQDGDKPLENETLEKYIRYLEGLLNFCDNRVIEEMKKDSPNLFPKRGRKPIAHLSEKEVNAIQESAEGFEGWSGSIMRFIASFYPATGLRPSELRTARIEDLDVKNWTFRVRNPKGAGSYGERRVVSIMPQAEEATLRFLRERREYIRSKGLGDSKYLIPNLSSGKDSIYSSNHFRKLKKRLQDATGIEFRIKDYRSTFASLSVMKDPSALPYVSRQLGHASPDTTVRFYADMELIDAGNSLRRMWATDRKVVPSKKVLSQAEKKEENEAKNSIKALIGGSSYLPGYG